MEAATVPDGDALLPAENEAGVALAALHAGLAAVAWGHGVEAGGRTSTGVRIVMTVARARECWKTHTRGTDSWP